VTVLGFREPHVSDHLHGFLPSVDTRTARSPERNGCLRQERSSAADGLDLDAAREAILERAQNVICGAVLLIEVVPREIEAFKRELERARIPATVRLTRGRDIEAACGQLASVR